MKTRLAFLVALAATTIFVSCADNGVALYSITVEQNSQNGTAESQFEKAEAGTAVIVTAEPAQGKRLDKWVFSTKVVLFGATTPISEAFQNPVKFVMPASDVTITPVFGEYRFSVFVNEPEGGAAIGSATATPSADILPGETVTIEATVANSDYLFAYWEINTNNVSPVPTENPGSFVMPSEDVTVTPVIKPRSSFYKVNIGSDDPVAIGQFDRIVSADPVSERALVDGVLVGTTVSYTGYAKDGYEVFQWSVWNDSEGRMFSGATLTFEVNHTSNHLAIPWIRAIQIP